jgi:hypothetical protein
MAWRFRVYRRVKVLPGVHVNLSRSGPSLTLGARGAHVTFGKRGVTRTIGIPGTGVYWTNRQGYHSGMHSHVLQPHTVAPTSPEQSQGTPWPIVLVIGFLAFVLFAWLSMR